jgi:hypothetical protein
MEKRRMKNLVRMNLDDGQDSEEGENESECDVPELFGSEDGAQDQEYDDDGNFNCCMNREFESNLCISSDF